MAMVMEKNLYTLLAGLLEYPKEDLIVRAEECMKRLLSEESYPKDIAEEFNKFVQDVKEVPLDDIQGVYSYTFELTSDFTLDMGYHLYDGFKRSNNLSTIKGMYKAHNFPFEEIAKGELPDHLPVMLYFLGTLKDEALKKDFRESFVILALEKLHKNFDKNRRNVYSHLISVIYRVLDKDVKEVK